MPLQICLGALVVGGYNASKVLNYARVDTCAVKEDKASDPVWAEEKTSAKSKISIYALLGMSAMVDWPMRKDPKQLRGIDPVAPCVFQ